MEEEMEEELSNFSRRSNNDVSSIEDHDAGVKKCPYAVT